MTVQELAELINRRILEGTLDPDAIVVRPFCFCDEGSGLVEAAHFDQVLRTWESAPRVSPGGRLYKYGNVNSRETAHSTKTAKLG